MRDAIRKGLYMGAAFSDFILSFAQLSIIHAKSPIITIIKSANRKLALGGVEARSEVYSHSRKGASRGSGRERGA